MLFDNTKTTTKLPESYYKWTKQHKQNRSTMARKGSYEGSMQDGDLVFEEPASSGTVNLTVGTTPHPLTGSSTSFGPSSSSSLNKKRKRSGHLQRDQEEGAAKNLRLEDGYPNTENLLRLFVIFNYTNFDGEQSEREGSEEDVSNLVDSFSKLGHETVYFQDLNDYDTLSRLKDIQLLCSSGCIHMINLIFMSHGDGNDSYSFVTNDNGSFSIETVRDMFSNIECPGLLGKPKFFCGIFCRNYEELPNACEEMIPPQSPTTSSDIQQQINQPNTQSLEDNGIEYDSDVKKLYQDPPFDLKFINVYKRIMAYQSSKMDMNFTDDPNCHQEVEVEGSGDMTTFFSCKPKEISYRHPRRGSFMVQCFCEILDKFGQTHPLLELNRLLEERMKTNCDLECKFVPDLENSMQKPCYLADGK